MSKLSTLERSLGSLCFLNWKIKTSLTAKEACKRAVDVGLRYFGKEFSKQSEKRWVDHFLQLLLPAVLLHDPAKLTKLVDWLDPKRKQDAVEPALKEQMPLLFDVSEIFRSKPLGDQLDLQSRAAKCQDKSNRLLYQCFMAYRDGDNAAFDEALLLSTEQHAKSVRALLKKQTVTPMFIVARFQSVLHSLAQQKGMKPKPLPAELSPFVIPPIK
jgi:hypothetical protein